MPVTRSAKKAMRRDVRRTGRNTITRSQLKTAIAKEKNEPNAKNLKQAYSIIDKAAQKKIIHPNKAARMKSKLAAPSIKIDKKSIKKTVKKTAKRRSNKNVKTR